eukprot:TRINITY_DN11301_c0_g3_i1.p1 TRINITY_DN11301_c0_g3~~TRINITY_DN11301_c0_g3_i1.p1  ORF type:complete len:985 (+),score=252.39 TRINITY_DN11301_c0_g3_i1:51-3005(+)
MDKCQVLEAIRNSLSTNESTRKNAETILIRLRGSAGFLWCLLELMSSNELELGLKQAAAIQFRQTTEQSWDSSLPDDRTAKNTLRANIIPCAASAHPSIRVHLLASLQAIFKADFPQAWPDLPQLLLSLLNSSDIPKIQASLLTTDALFKSYSIPGNSKMTAILYGLIEAFFPVLLKFTQYLSTLSTPESYPMKHLVSKIFFSATKCHLPKYFTPEKLAPWLDVLLVLFNESSSAQFNVNHEYWKTKKIIATLFDRMYNRYSLKDDSEDNQIGEFYKEKYALKVLEVFLNALSKGVNGVPPKVKTACLHYINTCLPAKITWTVLKLHLDTILKTIFFPILLFGEEDNELFNNDPQEFLRRQSDEDIVVDDPRAVVLSFIFDLIDTRGIQHMVPWIDYMIKDLLMKYQAAPLQHQNIQYKEAVLIVFGSIADHLSSLPQYKWEEFVKQHVLPEFSNNFGFMRARAVRTFAQFNELCQKNESLFLAGSQLTIQALNDKELPVRANAAIALKHLLGHPSVASKIEPILPQIVEAFLKIVSEIENEDIVDSFQTLVETYGSTMAGFALTIVKNLVERFLSVIKVTRNHKDMSSVSVGFTYLNTLKVLFSSLEGENQILANTAPYIQQLLITMSPDLQDFVLDYVHILAQYTHFVDEIDDMMCPVFAKMLSSVADWAILFLPEIFIPLDNFISKIPQKFLQLNQLPLITTVYKKAGAVKNDSKVLLFASQLVSSVLVWCKGSVDPILPDIIHLSTEYLKHSQHTETKLMILRVFSCCLYNNPTFTISYLESKGIFGDLFQLFFNLIKEGQVKTLNDIKTFIFGLVSLFEVTQLPNSLHVFLKPTLEVIIHLQQKYLHFLEEKVKQLKKKEEHGTADKKLNLDEIKHLVNPQKVLNDEDVSSEFRGTLSPALLAKLESYGYGSNSDEEDESELPSFFVDLDELVYFIDIQKEFSAKNGPLYDQLFNSLNGENKQLLQQMIQEANRRKVNS